MQKISLRTAIIMIVCFVAFMLAMLLSPDFEAFVKRATQWWRDAKWVCTLIGLAGLGGLYLLSLVLSFLTASRKRRLDAERLRRGKDVSVFQEPNESTHK